MEDNIYNINRLLEEISVELEDKNESLDVESDLLGMLSMLLNNGFKEPTVLDENKISMEKENVGFVIIFDNADLDFMFDSSFDTIGERLNSVEDDVVIKWLSLDAEITTPLLEDNIEEFTQLLQSKDFVDFLPILSLPTTSKKEKLFESASRLPDGLKVHSDLIVEQELIGILNNPDKIGIQQFNLVAYVYNSIKERYKNLPIKPTLRQEENERNHNIFFIEIGSLRLRCDCTNFFGLGYCEFYLKEYSEIIFIEKESIYDDKIDLFISSIVYEFCKHIEKRYL